MFRALSTDKTMEKRENKGKRKNKNSVSNYLVMRR